MPPFFNSHSLKNMILLVTCTLFTYVCFAQQLQNFHLTGKLESYSIKTVTLLYYDTSGIPIETTDTLSNGVFTFSGFINQPTEARLSCDITSAKKYYNDSNYIPVFFIEPAIMKMEIKEGHFKAFKLTGSKTQDEYRNLETEKAAIYKQTMPFSSQLDKLNDSLAMALKMKDTVRMYEVLALKQKIHAQLKPYERTITAIDVQFVAHHPDSYLSAYLLFCALREPPRDTIKYYFRKLSPVVQNSYYGEKNKVSLGLKEILPNGAIFPDMTGTDTAGRNTTLNSIINQQQYTLIIFWASWCVPCRQHAPEYKKICSQYKSQGLQVITITEDSNKKDWLAAIVHDGTQDMTHFFPDDIKKLSKLCGLNTIPAEILLSNNKVIDKFEGADYKYSRLNVLNNKLQQLFAPANKP